MKKERRKQDKRVWKQERLLQGKYDPKWTKRFQSKSLVLYIVLYMEAISASTPVRFCPQDFPLAVSTIYGQASFGIPYKMLDAVIVVPRESWTELCRSCVGEKEVAVTVNNIDTSKGNIVTYKKKIQQHIKEIKSHIK